MSGSRREYVATVRRANTEKSLPLTLDSSEHPAITLSIPSEQSLLNSYSQFLEAAFGCTRDTAEKALEMFMPPLRYLLATRASLVLIGTGAIDTPTPSGGELSSLPLNQRD